MAKYFRRRFRKRRVFRRRGYKRRRTFRRARRYNRRSRRIGRVLKRAFRRNYWIARKTAAFPDRIYTKLFGSFKFDFSYASNVLNTYTGFKIYPQDPCYWWDYLSGSSGLSSATGVTDYVANIDRYVNSTTGYKKFRYTKVKITFTVENYTGCTANTNATGAMQNNIQGHGDVLMGAMPVPYLGQTFTMPTDQEWPVSLDWKYKNVKMPYSFFITDTTGSTGRGIWNQKVNSPGSKKTLKLTYRPWRIERVKRSNYMIDDDYETALYTAGGIASTVGRKHEIDLFVFNPWYLNTKYNQYMDCRITVACKIFGYFYQPRQVQQ